MDGVMASGVVSGGRMKIRLSQANLDTIASWPEGTPVELWVERKRATRSRAQTAYYWSVVIALLVKATGHLPEEVHEAMKAKFATRFVNFAQAGQSVAVGRSTTSMNKAEFSAYLDAIREWAAQTMGLDIPDPDPFHGQEMP